MSALPAATLVAGAWCAGVALGQVLLPAGPGGALLSAAALGLAAAALAFAAVTRPAWPALLLVAALAGAVRVGGAAPDPGETARAAALAGRSVHLAGLVVDDPRETSTGVEVMVAPDGGDYGRVLVRERGPVTVASGDRVEVRGIAHLPSRTPEFDRRAYLAQQGAHLELTATAFNVDEHSAGPGALPAAIRASFQSAVATLLPAPHAAVLVGIVLGVRQGIPRQLDQQLIATGLVHLLVLSGLKVAVFARLAAAALAPLLGPRAPLPVAGLVALYALVGGATPAAVRAAGMGALTLLAGALGRPTHVWTSLAMAAAAMLGWRPELVFDVGFQLSFLGTSAIILLTPAFERRLHFLPRLVREPFAVTCAAQVGTLPVMAQGFHVLSPVAPLANAAVLPLLPAMVGAGLLLAPAALLPEAGRQLALPLALSLVYLEQVAALLARLPAAAIPIPGFPPWATAIYYGSGSATLLALRSQGTRRLAAAGGALAVAGGVVAWQLPAVLHPPPSVAFLAVGDGDAVLLTGPGGAVLVDGGASPTALGAALGSQLPPWTRALDALVLTGSGQGQAGGLVGLQLTARRLLLPNAALEGSAWRSVALDQESRGARLELAAAGETLELGGLPVQVLAPEPDVRPGDPGAAALALRAVLPGGRAACILGPLDLAAQAQVAARLDGPCDYLLVAGGGRSAPAAGLLARARPEAFVVSSSGGRLARGLPESILRRTDQEGTIVFAPDG